VYRNERFPRTNAQYTPEAGVRMRRACFRSGRRIRINDDDDNAEAISALVERAIYDSAAQTDCR